MTYAALRFNAMAGGEVFDSFTERRISGMQRFNPNVI